MEWRLQPQGEGHPHLPHPSPSPRQDTYIVQFPREQVYYVPPPENAVFFERHRNPPKPSKTKCCPGWLILTLILLCVVAILGIAIAILYFLYKPTYPSFSVTKMVVLMNNSSKPVYEITLTANNPNARSGLEYDKDGDVSLLFKRGIVGKGKFPGLKQEAEASSKVKVEVKGNSSMNENERKRDEGVITFDLEMRIGVKSEAGSLHLWTMHCNVACKFKVKSLGNDTRVLSQQCNTNS